MNTRKQCRHSGLGRFARISLAALFVFSLSWMTACEDEAFDHDPPAGMGTVYIVNNTGDGMDVFVDGARVEGVGSGRKRYYDLVPGVHRVVLDADDSPRSWAGDVDVLENEKTIAEVGLDSTDYRRFDVFIYYR